MNANLAFAPISGTNALYDTPGVDFLMDKELAETGETTGAADFVEWIDFDGPESDFDENAADEIIRQAGFRRTSAWNFDLEYATTNIEKAAQNTD